MEYVRVIFAGARRTVYVDGEAGGFTDTPFRLERGTHVFHLGEPQNYQPLFQTKVVSSTTSDDPLEIVFVLARTEDS